MKTLLVILSSVLITGCGAQSGVSLATLSRVPVLGNTLTASVSDPSATYATASVTVSSSMAQLKPLYQTIYDFSTNTNQGWSSFMALDGGGFTLGPDYSAGTMSYTSNANGWHGIANLTSPLLTDYIMLAEWNATTLGSLNLLASCMRAQVGLDSHYMFGMWANTYYIYVRTGGIFTNIASAAGFTPVAGTTYMIKTYAVGNLLKLKLWTKGSAEPAAWAVSVTDNNFASGYPCVDMYTNQVAAFDNIRIGSSTYTTDFVTTNPTFTYAPVTLSTRTVASVASSIVTSGSDSVVYEVSIDGGATFLTWNGSAWVTNTTGYSGAISLATLSANISTVPASMKMVIRAYLHSQLGYSSPAFGDLTFTLQ